MTKMASQNDTTFVSHKSFNELSLAAGRQLSHPPEGEDVVISGMAGKFPDADGVYELSEKLFNKVDMVSDDERRWKPINPEIPQRTGKIYNVEKFDAGFFGVHQHQADFMDPMFRTVYEKTYEAIVDAGYHPSELAGSNTGCFTAIANTENEIYCFYLKNMRNVDAIIGNMPSALCNRLCYYFKLNGPSYNSDTACSSSFAALEHAYRNIRDGTCDRAIVAASNLCLQSVVSLQLKRMGALSRDGCCRSFDNDASGFARSEGTCVVLLEKAKDARRIYAQFVHAKSNCDGFKDKGITYPSSQMQVALLKDLYEECEIDPKGLTFVEAHGTGTIVGDPEEINSIDQIFCKGRDKPLYVGSVKSNIGHTEPAAGLCSLIKVLIAMETGFIPPNINLKKNREGVDALEKGRIVVVNEKMNMPDDNGLFGVNSFGLGGVNAHVLLRWNKKVKTNERAKDKLPRLVCVSGRTRESVEVILDDIKNRAFDAEYIKLLHTVFRKDTIGHFFRGYTLFGKNGEIDRSIIQTEKTEKICLLFTGFDRKWEKIANQLSAIPLFAASMKKIQNILSETNISLSEIISHEGETTCDILITVVAQICLVDILKNLGVVPDFLVGIGTGDLVAAYFDDYLTLREVLLSSLYVAFVVGNPKNDSLIQQIENMKKIIPDKKSLFKKWSKNGHKMHSAEYFLQSALSPISIEEAKASLPINSLTVLIGSCLTTDENVNLIRLVEVDSKDYVSNFLANLGCLYNNGRNMELDKLYPSVQWPVSRGTPMISPLIHWLHDEDYHVFSYVDAIESNVSYSLVDVNIQYEEWNFITGHLVDGKNLFPAPAYLLIAWETLGKMLGKATCSMRVCFENVKIVNLCQIPSEGMLTLVVSVQKQTKKFEITKGDDVLVCGNICVMDEDDEVEFLPSLTQTFHDEFQMTERDIYKELNLRGYNYTGQFRSLKSSDIEINKGAVHWWNNWISLMDCMLQMKVLKMDTRNLYVPKRFQKITIDAPNHAIFTKKYTDNILPVYYSHATNTIRCGNVTIQGTVLVPIPMKKRAEAVLETYKFVPNDGVFPLEQSVRIMTELILENLNAISVKSVEINVESRTELISPLLVKILCDLPLIQSEIVVFSDVEFELPGVRVKNKNFNAEKDINLIIGVDIFSRAKSLDELLNVVKAKNGYIIARQAVDFDATTLNRHEIEILCVHKNEKETLILLRGTVQNNWQKIIDVTDNEGTFEWLPELQNSINKNERVIVYAEGEPTNGILGFLNCLRLEPNGDKISCVFINQNAPKFDPNIEFYRRQLAKNFAVNVWKDSKWGTYRHLPLGEEKTVKSDQCYVNMMVRGDLSSLRWLEGSLKKNSSVDCDSKLVHVYYSAINFRDFMIASGRISVDIFAPKRTEQECILGIEFSGRDCTGKRVMGMIPNGAISNLITSDPYLLMPIPEEWSMADAATVPVVYATVIYAFIMRAEIKFGQSVLIHSGAGDFGQAGINIALHYGCTAFTTVGTQEERNFIQKQFPQIPESHIGNSRNCSFEQMIAEQTKGRGVDIVLNSLSEEKLQASIRCLAPEGKFLEIGKIDLAKNNSLHMQRFSKGATIEGIVLDTLFLSTPEEKSKLISILKKCIEEGAVKPLTKTVFNNEEVEKAFRSMSTEKHIGKLLIKIREEEKDKICNVSSEMFESVRRVHCDAEGAYIIVGGLGGFGLELADWLVIRGARKLILTSRSGIKNAYQLARINKWKTYGANICIRTDDAGTLDGCTELLKAANSIGPVKAIFNLAVMLKDALFVNQNVNDFKICLVPKAYTTKHLDIISRKMCPHLEYFVVFSSIASGRGIAGQTNYGISNSIMERICEQRKIDGYPALAIQWGAIGDVGVLADSQNDNKEIIIEGTIQQSISSCLQVLDKLLRQDESIVASMVVAEKSSQISRFSNIIDAVMNILGIKDIKTVSLHATFPELGMDSLMAVKIKQTLALEYEVFVKRQEIRTMTISRLKELANNKDNDIVQPSDANLHGNTALDVSITKCLGPEENSNTPVVRMKTKDDKRGGTVYMLPGLGGTPVTQHNK